MRGAVLVELGGAGELAVASAAVAIAGVRGAVELELAVDRRRARRGPSSARSWSSSSAIATACDFREQRRVWLGAGPGGTGSLR